MSVGQISPQKIQALLAPQRDQVIVVAVADRPTDHQEQNLLQRVGHPPWLTRVVDLA